MNLVVCLLFSFFLRHVIARGGQRNPSLSTASGFGNDSFAGSARHLFEENQSHPRIDVARGYMTNLELEKAVKEFGQRCSHISRIYRAFWILESVLERV